jgi:uncharacterized protein (DUF433 family)
MNRDSMVVSMRLPVASGIRLKRMAKRFGWTPSDASARLVEEGLRRTEFALIDFRDTANGRQAFLQGTRLAVWMVVRLVREFGGNAERVADHLQRPLAAVQAALNYAQACPGEIEELMRENDAVDFEHISRLLPHASRVAVPR